MCGAGLDPLGFQDGFGWRTVTVQMMSASATACSTVSMAAMGRFEFGVQLLGKCVSALGRAAPDGDGFESANFADGAGVGGGLLAGAEDGEMLRV